MRRRVSKIAAAAATAAFVAGCAYNDHFDNRVDRFDVATEQSRDQMILTNIIRASRAEPLAFLQLGQITGSNSSAATMGLPSLILGPALSKVGPGGVASTAGANALGLDKQAVFGANPGASGYTANSVSTSGSTTFNVTPAESKDFYEGLLLSVEPETLAYFAEQGIARETLFDLFTAKVVEEKGGKISQFINDPLDPSFDAFQHYVDLAMRYGLSAEPDPNAKPAAKSNANGKNGEDTSTAGPSWRLCFDRAAWPPGTPYARNEPICGTKTKMPNPRMVSFVDQQGVPVKVNVFPRSTFAIFQYLGRIVAGGEEHEVKLNTLEAIGQPPLDDDDLFVVTRGGKGGACFLSVDYAGQTYCVPEDGALNTKRILGLLAQLIALNTSIRDIAIMPQVQLLQ